MNRTLFLNSLLLSFLVLFAQTTFSQNRQGLNSTQINQTVEQAENSVAFIENKGQWAPHVLYRADVPGGQALVTPEGMLLGIFNPESVKAVQDYHMRMEELQKENSSALEILGPEPKITGHGWKLKFIGANPATHQSVERNNESPDYYNYFLGDASTHATNVHSYTELTYKNVYEGIDVKYYTSIEGGIENDIIIHPKTDARPVKLEIEGISNIKLNSEGELILPTTAGEVVVPHPVSYLQETGEKINVEFVVTGDNVIGFSIPDYDRSKTLVIDPIVMRWATFATNNSSVTAHFHGIDVDASGNIYVTGQQSAAGLITVGAFQTVNNGSADLWIGKYTEPAIPGGTGARLWQTYLGGTGQDNPYALVVGLDGYPYITGLTQSSLNKTYGTGATAGPWTQRTSNGTNQQAFVLKVHPNGTWALVRELGSLSTTNFGINPYDIKVFPTGGGSFDLIDVGQITQASSSADGDIPAPIQPNGTAGTGTGGLNGIAFRLTSDLNTIVWARQYTSSGNVNEAFKISETDNAGNLYIGGVTAGTTGVSYNNPSTQTTRVGSQDGWLMKLTVSNGNAQWSRYFNASTGITDILCMQLNQAQTQMIIGGTTQGLSAANLINAYDNSYNGGTNDLFVASVPVTGASTTWGTYFGGNADESNMMGLNLDQNDDVYALGYTLSKNIITTGNPVQNASYDATNDDAIFFKLSGNGQTLLYNTYLGGTFDEYDPVGERGIRFSNCRIYLAITSGSNNFPMTAGTLTPTRLSATGNYPDVEPIIVSMANPPDLSANSITSGGNQNISCGQAPVQISASAPGYSIPGIIRNNVAQTNGTTGAYPSGLPTISSYQWQQSINGGATWTDIPGATGQNYTPIATPGTILYRRIINGDACNRDTTAIATVTVASLSPPTANNNGPICSGQTLQLTANTITGVTYSWSGPNSFLSNLQNPSIPNSTSAAAGTYTVVVSLTGTNCTASATTTVTIRPGPTANAGQPRAICPNTSTTLGGSPSTGSGGTAPYTYIWSPSGAPVSNPVVTPSLTTTYLVTVTDATNCTATASVLVSTTVSLSLSINSTSTTCGLNNGTATVTPLTGTGPFAYTWTPSGNTPTISNLASGNYSVIVSDSIGCSASATTSVGASVAVTLSPSSTTTTCGLNNGTTSVTALTGVGPFTYAWSNNGNTQTISNLPSGPYSVLVTGDGGCSASATTTVGSSVAVTLSPSSTTTTCGLNNGTATVAALTGVGPFIYAWSNNGNTQTISNLPSGPYSVLVTGDGGCSASATTTVGSSVAVTLLPSSTTTTCGLNNGTATVTALTGIGPFTYAWSNNGNTQTISNLPSGQYSVLVTGDGGCSASATTFVGSSVAVTAQITPVNTTCGLSNGSATATPLTGVGPFTYFWNNGRTTQTITSLFPATYRVTVTGTGGCSASASASVGSSVALTLTASSTNTTCGFTNGSASVSPVTGTGPFAYLWNTGAITPTITNLASGVYKVTVTGASNCTATATRTVASSRPLEAYTVVVHTKCGNNNGSASVEILSASGPFTYVWSNGRTTSSIFSLAPGTYFVTVTDGSGCTATSSATVNSSFALTGAAYGINAVCGVNTASAGVNIFTGAGPFSFNWSNGGNTQIISNIGTGSYNVTVTGAAGCSFKSGTTVTVADPVSPVPVCQSITVALSGNSASIAAEDIDNGSSDNCRIVSRVVTPTDFDCSNLGNNTVTLTVTDSAGNFSSCTAMVTIIDATPPVAICHNITVNLETSPLTIIAADVDDNSTDNCSIVSRDVTPSSFDCSNLGDNSVTLTVTDQSGNSSSCTAIVTVIAPANDVTATGGRLTCSVLSIQLTASSPAPVAAYSWSGPNNFSSIEQNPSVNDPGTYTVTVTNANNGCSSSGTADVTQDITEPGAQANGGRLTCTTTTIQITSSSQTGGVEFSWSGPNNFSSSEQNTDVTEPGTYTVIVTNTDNGCTSSANAEVTQDIEEPGVNADGGHLTCTTTSIQLTSSSPTGGVAFHWSGPNGYSSPDQNPFASEPGTYTVTVTNTDNGCTSSANAEVTQDIENPGATARGGRLTCVVTSIDLAGNSPTGGIGFAWSGPGGFTSTAQNPTVSEPGTYTVTVTNPTNGCSSSESALVEQDIAEPGVSVTGGRLTCAVTSIQITASSPTSGATYEWSGPGGFTSPDAITAISIPGTYTAKVTNTDNGCTSSASVNVTQDVTTPNSSASGGRLTCAVTSIQITASSTTSGVVYNWSGPGSFTSQLQNPTVNVSGTYTVIVTNTDNGCTSSSQAIVTRDITPPNVSVTGGVVTCFVPCVQITANSTTSGVTYSWTGPGGFTSNFQNPTVCDSGRYTVIILNTDNGCTASSSVQIDEVIPTLGGGCGSAGPIASGFELDGNATAVLPNRPDDWDLIYNGTSSPTFSTGVLTDAPSTSDNYFTIGTKDIDNVPSWRHTIGTTPDKDDILHAGAAQYGTQLYFFGDRYAVNGTAQIGFWFFKNDVRPVAGGVFSATHAVGDLLILSNFTNGGSVPVILVYEWVGSGGSAGSLDLINVSTNSIFATVNSTNVPSPWPYVPKSGPANIFPPGALFEGGLDLACLPDINLCFASFLMETRTSSSITASLKDFIAGNFFVNGSQSFSAKTDEEEQLPTLDSRIGLIAYPNPASDVTTFEFTMPQTGKVELEVFNSSGELVSVLFDNIAEENKTYKMDFSTLHLANGVYIYRFSAGDKIYSHRLAVIR